MADRKHARRKGAGAADQPALDVEALAAAARQARANACEREVFAALKPILDKHRCRLGTIQDVIDGQPGRTRVVVFAND